MNSIEYVTTRLESMIQRGMAKEDIIHGVAIATIGWPYVFGSWGEQCTPANRRRRKRDDHPTIVSACQVLNGDKATCQGCKWDLPVRMFDCRGFTYWLLQQVGITISGGGCTSQWNTKANWSEQGTIDRMPTDRTCCVFVQKNGKMEHTGMYLGDGTTVECSKGVQYTEPMSRKWTHYAIPVGLYEGGETPMPDPGETRPTLRKGAKGDIVKDMQNRLMQLGYALPKFGADGDYGSETIAAVKAFQAANGLQADGVTGPMTWKKLLDASGERYMVTIPDVPKAAAEALVKQYPGATMTKEGGN